MSTESKSFDPIWEDQVYGKNQQFSRYPYDIVVSFVYRNYPRTKPRSEVRILEIGCGSGNNLWFAAREGFSVAGIDGSAAAIDYARRRFDEDGLSGDLRVGDFCALPFGDESFDLVIDRGALTCCGLDAARRAAREVWRTLAPGGRFFINPYSDRHSSFLGGRPGPDGLTVEIAAGSLTNVGQICFYGRREVDALVSGDWKVLSVQHLENIEQTKPESTTHAEWRIVVEKPAHAGA